MKPLRPSVLDQLVGGRGRSLRPRSTSVEDVRRSVTRDLEWLLNARTTRAGPHIGFEEASRSSLAFGLCDLTMRTCGSDSDRNALAEHIRDALRVFEPRLLPHSIEVRLLEHPRPEQARSTYRIEGTLSVYPVQDEVVFDTELDVERCTMDIRDPC